MEVVAGQTFWHAELNRVTFGFGTLDVTAAATYPFNASIPQMLTTGRRRPYES